MIVVCPTYTRRHFLMSAGVAAGTAVTPTFVIAAEGGAALEIEPQPYFAEINRAVEALARLGAPIASEDARKLVELARRQDRTAIEAAEKILDRYTLARIELQPDGYAMASVGGAQKTLVEQGWRMFLVRLANPTGSLEKLEASTGFWTPGRILKRKSSEQQAGLLDTLNNAPLIERAWLLAELSEAAPLSGFELEYRIIQLFSRDHGRHSSYLGFGVGSEQLGSYEASKAYFAASRFYQGVALDFDCLPTRDVALKVRDFDGLGCVASLTIKDESDRIYPPQAVRLAPDFAFQPQIYRADGESVRLPAGVYTVESKRGPEYLRGMQTVTIAEGSSHIEVKLERWIDPAKWGWYSGDPHIHASGCSHYATPTEGVSPETIIRHVRGEALWIGEVLSWGPGWYYQKKFFTGEAESPPAGMEHPELQAANNASLQPRATPKDSESLLRYDVEVSGFPSSHCGHLMLLQLKEQDFPGSSQVEDWPSWNLPILRWAKSQGSVAGYAHCGQGMRVDSNEIPNYLIPGFDSIGTNEAIVDVTHGFVEFLCGCGTLPAAELNAWYHMLNCGFRLAMLGETDFPCMTDERPGAGRTYVRLDRPPTDNAGYEAWVRGLQEGRLYCGDGRSHFLEFTVNGRAGGDDDVALEEPTVVDIEALVAARLEPEPTAETKAILVKKDIFFPSWHIELARIGTTREVMVELVVNGVAVERTRLIADGTTQSVHFKTAIERSSWVALRLMPSSHTYPIFVHIGGKPIRASRRSARWCRTCVDKIWDVKWRFMRASERDHAARAFDHARKSYDDIVRESEIE